jgi:hypothetical protein
LSKLTRLDTETCPTASAFFVGNAFAGEGIQENAMQTVAPPRRDVLFSQRGFEATQVWLNCTTIILTERTQVIRELKVGIDRFEMSIGQLAAMKQSVNEAV